MTDSLFNVDEHDTGSSSDVSLDHGGVGASEGNLATTKPHSLSLYRKYRPQSFASDDLFGQPHIVNTLKNAVRLDRVGHAYLFCGPRGTGKTTTARILAKAVNCQHPDPANRPCNQCDACVAINTNATTDVIEIDAASNRGIDDIRELRERVKFAPTMLDTKFYIIDEAHQITGAAANAFLKTLEEPPSHTRFVLATTDPEELLQTIVSRCQRFDFRRIGLDAMTSCLDKVASAEQIAIDPEAVATIARHATGSLRDALGLLDQVAIYREEEDAENSMVTAELVRTVLGISRNDRVEGLVRAIAEHDPGAGLMVVNDAVEAGEDARQLGRQFINYLRILMLERASGSPDTDDAARELAQRFDLGQLAEITRVFADVDYKARHTALPQLPLELAIIRACLIDEPEGKSTPPPTEVRQETTAQPTPELPTQGRPSLPARQGGPSLKDRVRGASLAQGHTSATSPESDSRAPTASTSEGDSALPSHTASDQAASQSNNESSAQPTSAEPTEPPQSKELSSAPVANAGLDHIVELWDSIRMDVKALNRRTEALLQQADPLQVEGTHLTLVAAYPFHQKRLNDDDTRKIIEEVVERRSGSRMTVSCISRDEAQQVRAQRVNSDPTPPVQTTGQSGQRTRQERQRSGSGSPRSAVNEDDEGEPVHSSNGVASDARHLEEPAEDIEGPTPENTAMLANDEARIDAAMNIFDAEIVEEDR